MAHEQRTRRWLAGSFPARGLPVPALIALVTAFVMLVHNQAFFAAVAQVYPPAAGNRWFIVSAGLLFSAATALPLTLLCHRHTTKPLLIFVLLVAAPAAWFMDQYGVVIDVGMLENLRQTQIAEVRDLLSPGLLLWLLATALLPALLVWRLPLRYPRGPWRIGQPMLTAAGCLLLVFACVLPQGDQFSSFFREHKPLRYRANPGYPLVSALKLAGGGAAGERPLRAIGQDARVPSWDQDRELIIVVVGETARADHFSLNGYARDTNPELRRAGALSLSNVWSCGTSTAVSVPCMFSIRGAEGYDGDAARRTENVLDVIQRAGVAVLWLDNNSSSKGVAERIEYRDYRNPANNPECDEECRDTGMLAHLPAYIAAHPEGDIVIVLHQMGQHGPAYARRYPPQFEVYTPVCRTAELGDCSREEITNAYDNALRYTDHFLGRVIDFLKGYDSEFETLMLYLSDHGESLGEHGVYLHGLPNLLAPDAQRHVPAVVWAGRGMHDIDLRALAARRDARYTHDHLFHSLLGLLEIESEVYDPTLDIFHPVRVPPAEAEGVSR